MPVVNITARFLDTIKPPADGRVQYFDEKLTGLVLRVTSTGAASWSVIYHVATQKRRLTIGPYPAVGLAEARRRAQETLAAAARGEDPGAAKQAQRAAPTFKALADEYLERHASQKKSGAKDRQILERDVLPEWGRRKASEIRRRDVIDLLDGIKDRGAPIGANRTLALVRKVFNFGISRDLVEANPCAQVKAPAKENRRDRVLSADEIKTFWHGLDEADMSEGTRRALRLILVTAQRPGEVSGAELDEFDLKGGWWTIPAEKAKNGMTHRVPLSPLAQRLVRESEGPYLFPSPRGAGARHIEEHALATALRRNLETIGLDNLTPHDLRRTAASHMTGAGVPRLVVAKILNHAEPGVTAVYDRHGYDEEKRQALEKWERALKSMIGMKPALRVVVGAEKKPAMGGRA